MKKWLVLAGCITIPVLYFVARMFIDVWVEHTWGIEQSLRVMPFVDMPLFFLAPPMFYAVYRWAPWFGGIHSFKRRGLKYFYVFLSISFITSGFSRLVNGVGQISVIPLFVALDISSWVSCMAVAPSLAGFVLYLVMDLRAHQSSDKGIG